MPLQGYTMQGHPPAWRIGLALAASGWAAVTTHGAAGRVTALRGPMYQPTRSKSAAIAGPSVFLPRVPSLNVQTVVIANA
jgi:hypothetical protein